MERILIVPVQIFLDAGNVESKSIFCHKYSSLGTKETRISPEFLLNFNFQVKFWKENRQKKNKWKKLDLSSRNLHKKRTILQMRTEDVAIELGMPFGAFFTASKLEEYFEKRDNTENLRHKLSQSVATNPYFQKVF